MIRTTAAVLVLAGLAAPLHAAGKEDMLLAHLRARIETVAASLDGVLGVSLRDVKTGAAIDLHAAEPFPQASSIKLAVLYELYRQAEEGRIDLGEVTTPPLPRVGGGGVLQELGGRVSVTWRDLAVMMMGWSDNEATNLLIAKVGMDAVNRRLDALSLPAVRLRRRMLDLEAARAGRENVGTAEQMRRLVEAMHAGTGLPAERAADLRTVASVTKDSPFRTPLPEGLVVMDKPGSLEGVRCVTAYVDVPGRPYSIAIMTAYLKRDADGEEAIRQVSAAVYETFDRLARSSDLGRVISDR
ncbi:MAG: serine hydrolase [Vicinamibacteria bacterium]